MANLYIIISAFVSAVILGRIIIPNILIISLRKRLFDVPDERKVHKRPIPRLGGVTFFPVILFSLCVFTAVRLMTGHGPAETSTTDLVCEFLFLTGGLTLLYIVGIADDLIGVRYRKKFLVQIISAAMFPLSGLYINNFYGLFGIYLIPAEVGIPLTMLLVVFITNAINLIDGIDGLASGLSMVALLVRAFPHVELCHAGFRDGGCDYPVLFVQRVRQCGFGKEDFHGGYRQLDAGVYSELLCHQVLYV